MRLQLFIVGAAFITAIGSGALYAQTAPAPKPKPQPDVLIFTDGEKLIGQLKSAKGDSVVFKSDMAGEVTVAWSKIQELHTTHPFAVVAKSAKLGKHADISHIPEGTLEMTDQKITVTPATGAAQTVAVKDAGFLVPQPDFEKAINHDERFVSDWGGTVTAGVSLVESTQDSETLTGGITLVRTEPSETWLNPSTRTLVNVSASYGEISQPGVPSIKTDIVHAGLEEDKYFSPRLFGFVQTAFDHNYSLGLDVQQMYGGGIGWTVYKAATAELDLKAGVTYIHQNFYDSANNESLVGSTFGEIYTHKFAHGVLLNEQITLIPAWNDLNAYSGTGSVGLALPVHKRLSVSLNALDAFLNNPPPGFKKDSFQFTAGLSYALR